MPALGDATACLDCHTQGGTAQPFAFGGRAVRPAAGTPAADVEVCVVNPGNQLVGCAKSGTDGFFWAPVSNNVTIAQGAMTGARLNAGGTPGTPVLMGGQLGAGAAGGSCGNANCHGGAQGRVYVP
jgi:hypothetical protein